MNRTWLNWFWLIVWALFALSLLLVPFGYYTSEERGTGMPQLDGAMLWGWFGILPLFCISFVSPLAMAYLRKRYEPKWQLYGFAFPAVIVVAAHVVGLGMGILSEFLD